MLAATEAGAAAMAVAEKASAPPVPAVAVDPLAASRAERLAVLRAAHQAVPRAQAPVPVDPMVFRA